MNSRPVKRIEDVIRLRAAQLPEDAGPLAHPIRPDSYIKMDNFYTSTVYEKGEEHGPFAYGFFVLRPSLRMFFVGRARLVLQKRGKMHVLGGKGACGGWLAQELKA